MFIISEEEKQEVKEQIAFFKQHYDLIQRGAYYRLTEPTHPNCTVWEMASEDGSEALVSAVYHNAQANSVPVRVKVYGLKKDSLYQIYIASKEEAEKKKLPFGYEEGEQIEGSLFESCGIAIPTAVNSFQAWQIYIKEVTTA